MSTILRHMVCPSANLERRSETCCARFAGSAGPKKSPKSRHLDTIAQICRAISSQLRHVSTIAKNLLSSSISSTRPHNMVNFGPVAAEIGPIVWGTPINFNGFRVLAALLHGTQSDFAALDRGRYLYSAGRSSRWALAHISSLLSFFLSFFISSSNLSRRRLDVCHICTRVVALVRI